MGHIERLLHHFDIRVSLPWERHLAGPQRVWITTDLTDAFAQWLSCHEYREGYFETPESLEGESPAVDDFKEAIVRRVTDGLASIRADENTVVALYGVACLFGFMRTSELVSQVESAIRGRLLVCFPGEHENNTYRFRDAREGWDYLAVPITAEDGIRT